MKTIKYTVESTSESTSDYTLDSEVRTSESTSYPASEYEVLYFMIVMYSKCIVTCVIVWFSIVQILNKTTARF